MARLGITPVSFDNALDYRNGFDHWIQHGRYICPDCDIPEELYQVDYHVARKMLCPGEGFQSFRYRGV
jgi:hypothetical protein